MNPMSLSCLTIGPGPIQGIIFLE